MKALLEDSYGNDQIPRRTVLSLRRTGVSERVREEGWWGRSATSNDHLRAGSLSVLLGWSLFVLGGAIFAKFAEHGDATTPVAQRHLPAVAYGLVQWTGGVGLCLVGAASLVVVPSAVRLVRNESWSTIRRPLTWVLTTATTTTTVVVTTIALSLWAHHLGFRGRNGGNVVYGVAFVAWGLSIAVLVLVGTAAAIVVTRHLTISRKVMNGLALLAATLFVDMVVAGIGFFAWWGEIASANPAFLRNSFGSGVGVATGVFPPALILAGTLMVCGFLVGLVGTVRAGQCLGDVVR